MPTRPPTSYEEVRAARALGAARFAPATAEKRIARTIAAQVPDRRITEKQAAVMWKLIVRFRRSIDPAIVDLARSHMPSAPCISPMHMPKLVIS